MITSPVYYRYQRSRTLELAREICQRQRVEFWDYSQDTAIQQQKDQFADPAHLNDTGARHFSKRIAARIKGIIK
ncbi:hypothetical protein [Paraflavitalea speifideaquila]|uniref:hypothetical protein n=1 Tax=Paraflavitalea speifideaquila TaxID=3076558 RepID=UPI0028EC5062|nr:hypothetical protein [Paraflavitalea speifideiaquila]